MDWTEKVLFELKKTLDADKLHLVALSGGPDSVALLLLLHDFNYLIEAVHCNFHLRGEESDRDELFCKDLCAQLNVKLHVVHFDTNTYAQLHHVSIEMTARELRYDYFEKLRVAIHAADICVAHHRDDQVETFLLNLCRGTGLRGLTGMKECNGHITRPLLHFSRQEILQYLQKCNQTYVTDSSNLVANVKRNKLRLNIIPALREINPLFDMKIDQTITYLTEVQTIVERSIDDFIKKSQHLAVYYNAKGDVIAAYIQIQALKEYVNFPYLVYHILSSFKFNSTIIEEIVEKIEHVESGKIWFSDTHQLTINHGFIIIDPIESKNDNSYKIPEEGKFHLNESLVVSVFMIQKTADFKVSRNPMSITISGDDIKFPLEIRHPKADDKFQPFGMHGRKLITDFLKDEKVDVLTRRNTFILVDAEQRIIWVVGHRIDQRYAITSKTEKILCVTVQ